MKKILIVDDQKITLKMAQHILSTQYKTVCALSGEEAITLYKREHPDMILTDLHMPAMSGFELQNTLQDMYAETIPVMFMTADESEDTESRSFENGAMDFIRKPFRPDVLLKRVQNIMDNLKQISSLTEEATIDNLTGLLNKGAKVAALTGVSFEEGKLGVVSLDGETGAFSEYYTDRLPVNFHGTGDIYSSTAVGALMNGMSVPDALALAADYTAECIRLTLKEENHSWYGGNFEQAVPFLLERMKKL